MRTVDFETAKALQELGYDGEYINFYRPNGQLDNIIDYLVIADPLIKERIPAPRLDDAAYWIRDKYQLGIEVSVTMAKCWAAHIYDYADAVIEQFCEIYDSYDEALEEGVKKVIEIIKTKSNEQ